jgi:uncharacterized protein (TIGR03382 family)
VHDQAGNTTLASMMTHLAGGGGCNAAGGSGSGLALLLALIALVSLRRMISA